MPRQPGYGLRKHRASGIWHYDFIIAGHRFSGSTGEREERAAKGRARIIRAEKEALIAADRGRACMSFGQASSRWFAERGQFRKGQQNIAFQLAWLQREIGMATPLTSIDDNMLARLVARRRAGQKPGEVVTAATVNRQMVEPLRAIMRRAGKLWGQPVQEIAWRDHLMPEPRGRVRELTPEEEQRLVNAIRPDYLPVITVAFLRGLRKAEGALLEWSQLDWECRFARITEKGGEVRRVALGETVAGIIRAERGRHPRAVWTYARKRRLPPERPGAPWREVGERVPITLSGLNTEWRRARRRAGIASTRADRENGLAFHDLRHTFASRLLRACRDLKLVSVALGHADIATTQRYAHVLEEDVVAGLALLAPARTPADTPGENPGTAAPRAKNPNHVRRKA